MCFTQLLACCASADFLGVFHKVAGQGEDEKKLGPWTFSVLEAAQLVMKNLDAKIQQHFLYLYGHLRYSPRTEKHIQQLSAT